MAVVFIYYVKLYSKYNTKKLKIKIKIKNDSTQQIDSIQFSSDVDNLPPSLKSTI